MKIVRNECCPCGSGKKYKHCCLTIEEQNKYYTVFCDETGNSGSNYLDREQPFYVIAGWIVPIGIINNVECISKFASNLGTTGEIHGTKIIRRIAAQKEILNLFRIILLRGCIPTYIIAEKRYCIAGKIIETLLDPAYNDLVGNEYTSDNVMKRNLAEVVYQLNYELLSQFAIAYTTYNVELMIKTIDMIIQQLSERHSDLAQKISGSLLYIEENISTEKESHERMPNRAMSSLNLPVIVSYNNMLENLGRSINSYFSIVHDKTKQFEYAYTKVFKMYRDALEGIFPLTDGTKIILGFSHLKELTFEDSKDCLWIQAADLLASSIGRYLKTVYHNKELNDELKNIAKMTIPSTLLLFKNIQTFDWICSEETAKKICRGLL